MSHDATLKSLQEGYCGRLTTFGPDGYPYCVPLLYVWMDEQLYVHGTNARGHLHTNLEFNSRVCFEVDFPGQVFDYGRFECDISVSYRSVVAFSQAIPSAMLRPSSASANPCWRNTEDLTRGVPRDSFRD